MLKVLHIETGIHYRGGVRQIGKLVNNLVEYQVDQFLACLEISPLPDKVQNSIKDCFRLSRGNFVRILNLGDLIRFVDKHQINLVHAHDSHAHSLSILLKIFRSSLKIVVTRRTSGAIEFGSKSKYQGFSIQYIAISEHIKDRLTVGGVDDNRIAVIPSMINLSLFENMNQAGKERPSDGRIKIISAGIFERPKGFYDTVRAIHKLSKKRTDFKYTIYGIGREFDNIKKYVSENKLEDVIDLPGWHDKPIEFLNEADIYLAPSHREALGIALIEAQAAGLPVAASSIPSHREIIINGESGLLFEPGDIDGIIEKLTLLLDDTELAESVARKGRQIVRRYDSQVITERIFRLYSQLVAADK